MSVLEKIYDVVPIWFQNLMTSLAGYQRNRQRYGKVYYKELAFLKEFDRWPFERKQLYQRQALVDFVRFAYEHSPFYKKLYSGIDIESINDIEDLKRLPVVDKELLRKNIDRVLALPRKRLVEGHTGGTTGKSLVVLNSVEDTNRRMAMLDHFKARVGFVHLRMRRATFNGKHIIPPKQKKKVFWRYNAACKQMIYSSFFLTEENMGSYVQSLNRFKPQAIDGFFTSILDLANYVDRHQIRLLFKPIAIFPTSETLTEVGRAQIEKVFDCKVYDQYASSEGAPFVTECTQQRLHIEMASGVFEKLGEDSDEVLVTSFTTHGMPLIRYRIGDAMSFSSDVCACGIESPLIKKIQGRELDFLYTAKGARINGGNVANLFKNMPNALVRAQLIQEKTEEVTALLEVDKTLYRPEYDQLLRREFLHKFGIETRLSIQHVDRIPREKSGKFQMIVQRVPAIECGTGQNED